MVKQKRLRETESKKVETPSAGFSKAVKKWWSDILGARDYLRYLEKEDRKRRLAGQFLTLITIVLGIYYLLWHAGHINWAAGTYSFIFFLAEFTGLLLFSFFSFNAWFLRFHSPQGVALEKPFSVDIFITVAGESVELVKKTVRAALQIDYPLKKVFVLDDHGSVVYQGLTERLGCGYFAREEHHHAKAGNLNYAFQRTSGDLILTLDADQVPQPQIINKLIGYFKFPWIGFVQSKQNFEVPIGDPFGNTDRIFYNVMQTGKDTDNAAFSCGSGVIYRRKALEEIGGFSTWNLVEDVHTSMLLHDRGWRSIYYNYPVTQGSAPAEIYGVYRQRRQWAADSLRILFWDNPFGREGLTFKQKLQYFHLGFVYLVAAFVMPLFFLTPTWALLTNNFVLIAPVNEYVLHRFPYFIAMSVAYGILNYPTPYMRAFQMWTGLFPAFIHATWMALRSRKSKPSYQVNSKPAEKMKLRNPWPAILPQQAIIFLSIFSVIYVFFVEVKAWDFYLLNLVWSLWSAWTMSGICLAAVRSHRWPTEITLETRRVPSFFSQTKELSITVIATVMMTLFFTTMDRFKADQRLDHFRLSVLSAFGLEKPVPSIPMEIHKDLDVSNRYMKSENKVEQPEKRWFVDPPPERGERQKKHEAVKIETPKKNSTPRKREHWVINVVSVKTNEDAMAYKKRLMAMGFPAYGFRAKVKGEEWIRVRVGFFGNRKEAREAAQEIEKKFTPEGPYWITKVSVKEMEDLLGK